MMPLLTFTLSNGLSILKALASYALSTGSSIAEGCSGS